MGSHFNIELLISEVKCRPQLWHQKHSKSYKSITASDKLWDEIGVIFNNTGTAVKTKWKTLKDTFRKEINKISASRSGAGTSTYKPKWRYFELMLFMKDIVTPESKRGNLTPPTNYAFIAVEDFREESFEDNINGTGDNTASQSSSHSISNESTSQRSELVNSRIPSSRKTARRNTPVEDFNIGMVKTEQKKIKLSEKEIEKNDDSSDLMFFKSLLPYLEPLDPIEKLQMRNKIQQIVIDAHIQMKQKST